jgi:mucin-19
MERAMTKSEAAKRPAANPLYLRRQSMLRGGLGLRTKASILVGSATCTLLSAEAALANGPGAWHHQPTQLPQISAAQNNANQANDQANKQAHTWAISRGGSGANVGSSFNTAVSAGAGHLSTSLSHSQGSGALAANDLNLTSARQYFLPDTLANFKSLTIQIGNTREVVNLGTRLTAAELVAAQQVLTSGVQTIKLTAAGTASGGTITLSSGMLTALDNSLGGSIGSLTIAPGVKVIDSVGSLALNGRLTNYGSIFTASATAGSVDSISAASIVNAGGAAISSYSGGGGLLAADPALTAASSITNLGKISSSGSLTLTAPVIYNSQTNQSSSSTSNSLPTINAAGNVNINTTELHNQGIIAATTGNVNIASSKALLIDNVNGSLQANRGNINATANNADVNISGGDLLSKQLNMTAGSGNVDLNAANVSGRINATADCVHVITASSQILGDISASGDPQFISTNGNQIIDGLIGVSGGADLAFIAAGNVVSAVGGKINTSPAANGNGGNLTIIAGANVNGDSTSATVSGGNLTGGIIDLNGGNGGKGALTQITTAGAGNGNGGYIQMVAYAGTAKNSGNIIVPSKVTIDASGQGGGTNGDVMLIAGGATTAITTGPITGRNITLMAAPPSMTVSPVIFNSGINMSGPTAFSSSGTTQNSTIVTGTLTGTSVTVVTGASFGSTSKPIDVEASSLALTSNSNKSSVYVIDKSATALNLSNISQGSNGTFNLTAAGDVNISGPLSVQTINISTSGTGAISTTGGGSITATTATLGSGTGAINVASAINNLALKTTGAVTVTQVSPTALVLGAVTGVPQAINITNKGDITVSKAVNAGSFSFNSTTGNVNVNAAMGSLKAPNQTSSITISGGSIFVSGGSTAASTVTLTAASGSIGTSAKPFADLGANLTAKAPNGSVFLNQTGDVIVAGNSTATGSFSIKSSGSISTGQIDANNLNLTASKAINLNGVVRSSDGSTASTITTKIGSDFTVGAAGDVSANFKGKSFNDNLDVPGSVTISGKLDSPFNGIYIFAGNAISVNGGGSVTGFLNTTSKTFSNAGTIDGLFVDITATGSGLSAISNTGTIGATGNFVTLTTTNVAAGITNGVSGKITAGSVFINTSNLANNGSLFVDTGASVFYPVLQISSNGTLTINGAPGGITTSNYGAIGLFANKDVVIGGTSDINNPFGQPTNLGSFSVGAEKGYLITPMTGIHVVTDPSGKDGEINITVQAIKYANSASGPFTMTADGTAATSPTSGQNIQLFLPGTKGGVSIGSGPGQLELSAQGVTNGAVTVSTPGILTIDTAFLNATGKTAAAGAPLSLNGVAGIVIKGNFTTKNSDGSFADIQLITSSKTPFDIGAASTTNGQTNIAGGEGIAGNLISLITPGGVTIGATNVLSGANAVFTSGGTVTNNGSIVTPALVLGPASGTATLLNNGSISATGSDLTVNALNGSLVFNTGSGATIGNNLSTLTVSSNKGGISFTGANPGLKAHTIVIDAKLGAIAFGSGNQAMQVNAIADSNGNAGTVDIYGKSLTNGTGGLAINTGNGTGTGNGGVLDIELSDSKPLVIGQSGISINLFSTGSGAPPTVILNNTGSINIDPNFLTINASGGAIGGVLAAHSAKGPLYVSDINALNLQGFSSETFISGSSSTFLVGGAKAGANGFGIASATANLNADTQITVANAGSIDLTKANFSTVDLTLSSTKGSLIFANGSTLTVNQDGSGNGGQINLNAASITGTGLNLVASSATATGGSVAINLNGTKTLTISADPAATFAAINVNAGAGKSGGSISVINSANLRVDGNALSFGSSFASGAGPDLDLTSTKGTLFVQNSETLSGFLNTATFGSASKTTFVLSGATAKGNGLSYGNLTSAFTADTINIVNTAGNIDATTASGSLNAHAISLSAPAASLLFDPSSTFSAQVDGANNGGTISLTAKSIPNLATLTLDAHGTVAGSGGTVNLKLTSTTLYTIDSTGPVIDVANGGTQGGSISITNGGALAIKAANNLNFGSGFGAGTGPSLSLAAQGYLNVDGSGSYMSGFENLSFASNSKTVFQLANATAITGNGITSGSAPSAVNLSFANNGGAIDGQGQTLTATKSVNLTALTDIGSSFSPINISAPVIAVQTGAAGNAYISIATGGTAVQGNVGKAFNISAATGTLTVGGTSAGKGISAGNLNVTFADAALNNTDTLTLGNLSTTSGDLVIISNAQNMVVSPNALLATNNGSIYLDNTNTSLTNQPKITLQSGSELHAVGTVFDATQGNVYVYIGKAPNFNNLPPTPYFRATGTIPPNGTYSGSGIYFSDSVKGTAGTITITDKTDSFQSVGGRTVSFNTGTYAASQIFLQANVTIIADPPVIPYAITVPSPNLQPIISSAPATAIALQKTVLTAGNTGITPVLQATSLASPANASAFTPTALTTDLNFYASDFSPANISTNINTALSGETQSALAGSATVSRNARQDSGASSNQNLDQGALLLSPTENTHIATPYGDVTVQAGSVALLISSDKGLAVYDLHDRHRGAVTISQGLHKVDLIPGQSAFINLKAQCSNFEQANPAAFVAYRGLRSRALDERFTLHQAEFDSISMIKGLTPLHKMAHAEAATGRRTVATVLKTAAILQSLNQGGEAFAYRLSPELTAYAR